MRRFALRLVTSSSPAVVPSPFTAHRPAAAVAASIRTTSLPVPQCLAVQKVHRALPVRLTCSPQRRRLSTCARAGTPTAAEAAAAAAAPTAAGGGGSGSSSSMAEGSVGGVAATSRALVRNVEGEDSMYVFLTLGGKGQNLNRPKEEPLEKALGRLRAKAAPATSKKDKRKPQGNGNGSTGQYQEVPQLEVTLFADKDGGEAVDPAVPNQAAWARGKWLRVGTELFQVLYNPPLVDKINLVKRAIVGFDVLATQQLLFADKEATLYRWSRRRPGSTVWEDLGCTAQLYRPTDQDLGWALRVECTPGSFRAAAGGEPVLRGETVAAETGPVEAGPSGWAADTRAPQPLPLTQSPDLRIASYNILADQYAGSTYAQQVLFNYCPAQYLDPEYRKQLVVSELLRYNADVLCLQEVDDRMYSEYLLPHMELRGYAGQYTNKMGKVREGEATFWRSSRYRPVLLHDVLLREVFKEPLSAVHSPLGPMLESSPELRRALQKVATIAQMTVLQPLGGGTDPPLCILNTHLFFHPYAPHIRTLHTAAILEEAWAVLQGLQRDQAVHAAPVLLFCGDLNSDLNDGVPGVVELLQKGQLPADYWDWAEGAAFKWGMEEEEGTPEQQAAAPKPPGGALALAAASPPPAPAPAPPAPTPALAPAPGVVGAAVQLSCGPLCSADGLQTPFTNFTSGFQALLDYVWYCPKDVQVLGVVPIPSPEALGGFIPSQRYPSDHLAVVYDLRICRDAGGTSS